MADLTLSKITKRFGNVIACDKVSLQVDDGQFVSVLGPSGCGKSTLLNVVAGLEEMTDGDIMIGGRAVKHLGPYERDVAMVFQNYALYPHMTVAENIGFSLRLRRRPAKEIEQRVLEVAKMLELNELLDRLPRELSGGQQQRVAIGRAVIRKPSIFLFDEPFSNLDAGLRIRMRSEIKELHQRLGVTSLFVTHDQEEALSISDAIAVMRTGQIEQYDTAETVYSRPASKYVARFIGSPQMDIFQGDLIVRDGKPAYRIGNEQFDLPLEIRPPGFSVDLGVRPEHVLIGENGVPAEVYIVQPIGPFTYVTVLWDGGKATSRVNGISHLKPKEPVYIRFSPAGLHFFERATDKRVEINIVDS
jgi:multiple sugar transport system ATP-binding protein